MIDMQFKKLARVLGKTLWLLWLPFAVSASEFDEAQLAAGEGRYRDVITLLTGALSAEDVSELQQVVAYSNRGIAYSLLNAFGLAKQDLNAALALDPAHSLTLNQLGHLAANVDHDYELAVKFFETATAANFGPSQFGLARLYHLGLGIERDDKQAFALYRLAAENQYVLAYVPLGKMYLERTGGPQEGGPQEGGPQEGGPQEGGPQDDTIAVQWFIEAIKAGVVEGHYHLAVALEQGVGVAPDVANAISQYRQAAMQGHAPAQNALGYAYSQGVGVLQDYQLAAQWYRLAADQGDLSAMTRLALLLAGCPRTNVCNGELAVTLATEVLVTESSASTKNSLAAGLARLGKFDEATTVMRQAILDLPIGSTDEQAYRNRLALYESGEVYQF
ncbi:hypothetical protein N9P94_01430 [Pseudomonadales bacterium]|nr:hypothetical protein [Pseudomonadales bacterium]